MTGTWTPSTDVGGSGVTYDEADWLAGDYLDTDTGFFAAFNDVLGIGEYVSTTATTVAASALSAQNAAFTPCTSTTSNALASSGDVTFTTQSGKTLPVGMKLRATSNATPSTDWMVGYVKTYSGTSLVITMVSKGSGTGSKSDWTFSPAGEGAGDVMSTRQVSAGGIASGGGDFTADRTITVTKATGAEVCVGTNDTHAMTPKAWADSLAIQTLTDGATISQFNAATSAVGYVLLGGTGRTFQNPAGMIAGQTYTVIIADDGTGGRTITTWGGKLHGMSATLTTVAGKFYILTIVCVASDQTSGCTLTGPF